MQQLPLAEVDQELEDWRLDLVEVAGLEPLEEVNLRHLLVPVEEEAAQPGLLLVVDWRLLQRVLVDLLEEGCQQQTQQITARLDLEPNLMG